MKTPIMRNPLDITETIDWVIIPTMVEGSHTLVASSFTKVEMGNLNVVYGSVRLESGTVT